MCELRFGRLFLALGMLASDCKLIVLPGGLVKKSPKLIEGKQREHNEDK